MEPQIIAFNAVSIAGVLALAVYFIVLSLREDRVHPGAWAFLGSLSIFWLEGPFDWIGFCTYHPGHWFFPKEGWGPLSAPYGGLPVLVMFSYVLYFTLPAIGAAAFSRRLAGRGWNFPRTLLTVGLTIGFFWDMFWENIGTTVGIWRYSSASPGLIINAGELNQVPVYTSLAMAIMVMFTTYILGRDNTPSRRFIIEDWAGRRTRTSGGRLLLTAVLTVAASHAVYVPTMVPYWITKELGLQTARIEAASLFPGYNVPPQPL